MRAIVSLTILLTTAVLMTGAGGIAPAIYVGHDKVNHTFGKRGPGNDGVIADAPVKVSGNLRTGPGEAEVHENEIDVFYVVSGGSTIVTGGKLTDPKRVNATNLSGTNIEDGTFQAMNKGDFLVVPQNTPHQITPSGGPIILMTVKMPRTTTAH